MRSMKKSLQIRGIFAMTSRAIARKPKSRNEKCLIAGAQSVVIIRNFPNATGGAGEQVGPDRRCRERDWRREGSSRERAKCVLRHPDHESEERRQGLVAGLRLVFDDATSSADGAEPPYWRTDENRRLQGHEVHLQLGAEGGHEQQGRVGQEGRSCQESIRQEVRCCEEGLQGHEEALRKAA